jgi:hypothetical protein
MTLSPRRGLPDVRMSGTLQSSRSEYASRRTGVWIGGLLIMAKKTVHTTPNPSGKGWVNQVGGNIVSKHRTQDNAAGRGREIAKTRHTEHAIHGWGGTIREKNSYGGDSNPPRDKNR